jgi:hypothetical protein
MTDAPYERYKEALRLGHVAALHGRLDEAQADQDGGPAGPPGPAR